MRLSLRFKINFFIALVMVVTAAAILSLSHRDMVDAIFEAQESSAQNVLKLVELNIRGGYQRLLADRVDTLLQRKKRLKNLAFVAVSALEEFTGLEGRSGLAREDAAGAGLDWIGKAAFGSEYVFVFDKTGLVLSHPNPDIRGTSIEDLADMKGRNIVDAMGAGVIAEDGDSAVLRWDLGAKEPDESKEKLLCYFLPFPKTGWTVGAAVDIGDIETNARRQLENMIEALRKTFGEIRVASEGTVFVFDGKKQVLIAPAEFPAEDFAGLENATTGNLFLDDLTAALENGEASVPYALSLDGGGRRVKGEAFVGYFKSLDWYIAVQLPEQQIQGPAKQLVVLQSITIALVFLASLIAAFLLVSRVTRPMNMLADYAKEMASQDFTASEDQATPIDELPAKFKDEVGRLAASLLFMREELRKNIQALMKTTAAKERFESELSIAREIQLGILPKTFPPFPEMDEFDLHAVLTPAREVGGDLYDFYFMDDRHLCFCIGDVSDKGVPAALFMVITRTLINLVAKEETSPARMMTRVNDVLCVDNPRQMFVTLIIGVLDIRSGRIVYANGGHNPPIIVRRNEGASYRKKSSGPLLGVVEDVAYRDIVETLEPGDAFFMYTDGVTEAMDEDMKLYSDERLLEIVDSSQAESPEETILEVMRDVRRHAGPADQSDDIAMMMIRFAPTSGTK